jgi:aminoglycoside N3'-acetyltransferase
MVEVGGRIYVKATATLKDCETWEIIEQNSAYARESESKKWMDDSQITWATSSYARKYALNGLFCIDDVKDADATNTHWKEEKTTKKSETKSNPNWWFQKASTNKEFMEKCMDEDNFIRTIKWKYDVDDIVEQQLREAYRNLMWKNEDTVELPFE